MKTTKAFSLIFFAISCYLILASPVYAQQNSASNAITSAETSLKESYNAVKLAEASGANVDSLMITINDSTALLLKANLAYASTDFDSAYNYAIQSQSVLSEVPSQAMALKAIAQVKAGENSIFLLLSLSASIGLLFVALVSWVVLGKRQRGDTHAN